MVNDERNNDGVGDTRGTGVSSTRGPSSRGGRRARSFPSAGRGIVPALAGLLLAALTGCSLLQGFLGTGLPTARITGARLGGINLKSATLELGLEVLNGSPVPIPLTNFDYSLASQGKPFLSGKADLQKTIVPAGGKKTLSLPIEIPYSDLLKALKNVRPGHVVPYRAELGLSLDGPGGRALRLPMRKEGELPIPAVPDVRIESIEWGKLTLAEAGGRVKLRCVNRNQFPVDLQNFRYNLSLGGTQVANSALAKRVDFAPGGVGTLEIPISFSPASLGMAMLQVLRGENANYALKGAFDVKTPYGPMRLPIDKSGKAQLRR